MGTHQRWLPFLGDAVLLQLGEQTLTGVAASFDASLVLVEQALPGIAVGQPVVTRWWVGTERHRTVGLVEDVAADGTFSVRLSEQAQLSRRSSERLNLSLPLLVTPTRAGSLGAVARAAYSVDLSDGGLRAVLDPQTTLDVGELVEVEVDLGQQVERLLASVAWTREQVAGLQFRHPVDAEAWQQLVSA